MLLDIFAYGFIFVILAIIVIQIICLIAVIRMAIKKRKQSSINEFQPAFQNIKTPDETLKNNTVYISDDYTTIRSDGQPLTDDDVKFLIERGAKQAIDNYINSPNYRTYYELELEDKFYNNHYDKSEEICNVFQVLEQDAYEADDLDTKIKLLQMAIEAFEKAKNWHFKISKGGKMWFEDSWIYMNNSRGTFCWVDNVKKELAYRLKEKDVIIPWILKASESGFMQTSIYEAFQEEDKANLRNIINYLVESEQIVKTKKGNTYFITKA